MKLSWLECAYVRPFLGVLTNKVGQTDMVCDQSSLVGLCMQDSKSVSVVVMIFAQTHTDNSVSCYKVSAAS